MAEALLDAGILNEDGGYTGSLRESVILGLRGWLSEMGCENLSFFDNLAFAWTDDLESEFSLSDEGGWEAHIQEKNPRVVEQAAIQVGFNDWSVGAFALVCDGEGISRTVVGPRIEALMGVTGRATAWRVLRVLQTAMHTSGIGLPPAFVRELPGDVLGTDDDWADAPKECEEEDIMTTARFDRGQPVRACEWARESDPRLLRRARGYIRLRFQREHEDLQTSADANAGTVLTRAGFPNPEHAWAYNILCIASDLGTLIERHERRCGRPKYPYPARISDRMTQSRDFEPEAMPACIMRWSLCDNVERVLDDYMEILSGSHQPPPTTIVSLLPFLPEAMGDGPGTVRHAVETLRELIPIVTLCDALLDLLNEEDARREEGGDGVWPPGEKRPGGRAARERARIGIPAAPRSLMQMLGESAMEPSIGRRSGGELLRAQRHDLQQQVNLLHGLQALQDAAQNNPTARLQENICRL